MATAVADTGFSYSLVAMGALGLCLATFALAFGGGWAPEIRWGLVLLGAATAAGRRPRGAAARDFRPASTAKVLQAASLLTVQTALVALLGFYGMFAGVAVAALVVLGYYARAG